MLYRFQQFWLAVSSRPTTDDLQQAAQILGARLYAVFCQMQPGEQAHSLQVMRRVQQQNQTDRGLLAAALLHDCGKSRRPLRLWERVWIVLVKTGLPTQAKAWGRQPYTRINDLPFWQQPLIVAEQHAAWGAEMAANAGAAELTVRLIGCHQDKLPSQLTPMETNFLSVLQNADNES